MEASVIINKARLSLADIPSDTATSRWSDTRLLSLLNDAMQDLAFTTDIFNSVGYIQLMPGTSIYDISDVAIKLHRIEHASVALKAYSHSEMDAQLGLKWQAREGDKPLRIVSDLRKAGEFQIYPIPAGPSAVFDNSAFYGIITGVRYEDAQLSILGEFGDITIGDYMKVFYARSPVALSKGTDNLDTVITTPMLSMLNHYVVGHALRDNQDARNIELGLQELRQYRAAKEGFIAQYSKGGVERNRQSTYNPFG